MPTAKVVLGIALIETIGVLPSSAVAMSKPQPSPPDKRVMQGCTHGGPPEYAFQD
jgi:hypothetical protein